MRHPKQMPPHLDAIQNTQDAMHIILCNVWFIDARTRSSLYFQLFSGCLSCFVYGETHIFSGLFIQMRAWQLMKNPACCLEKHLRVRSILKCIPGVACGVVSLWQCVGPAATAAPVERLLQQGANLWQTEMWKGNQFKFLKYEQICI